MKTPPLAQLLRALAEPSDRETALVRQRRGDQLAVVASSPAAGADSAVVILHQRPRSAGADDIDHLAIAPSGVYVIGTRSYSGLVRVEGQRSGEPQLVIDRRDRTVLIDGLERRVAVVRDRLNADGHPGTPLHGVLCLIRAELPLLRTLRIRGYELLGPVPLARRLNRRGAINAAAITRLAGALRGPPLPE